MKKALFFSVIMVLVSLTTVFIACNSHNASIYRMWSFSNFHMVDASKASPMDNFAYNFLNKSLQSVKFQFSADKSVKICDSTGKVLSTGKFEMPDNKSIKFSFGNDSAVLYKIDNLSDTAVNLVDEKQQMVLHLTAKQNP